MARADQEAFRVETTTAILCLRCRLLVGLKGEPDILLRKREVHIELGHHFHGLSVEQRGLVDPLLHRFLGGWYQKRVTAH